MYAPPFYSYPLLLKIRKSIHPPFYSYPLLLKIRKCAHPLLFDTLEYACIILLEGYFYLIRLNIWYTRTCIWISRFKFSYSLYLYLIGVVNISDRESDIHYNTILLNWSGMTLRVASHLPVLTELRLIFREYCSGPSFMTHS